MGKPITIYKRRLRSFVNFMSREIFNSCKKNKNIRLAFQFNFKDEIIDLLVSIKKEDLSISFDIHGSSSDEDIKMDVILSKHLFSKKEYNKLNAELREFLRHEMEHIAQYHDSAKAEIYGYSASTNELEYFIQPFEIDAFLHGLNYKRKYLKTDMIVEIDNLLLDYYKLEDEDTVESIKAAWMNRLEEILPHTI